MDINEQQANETLGWYERGLIEFLEHIDQALEASDQAGDALSKGQVIEHLQAMRRLVHLLAKTQGSMLRTGQQIGRILQTIPGNKDQLDAFSNNAARTSRSLEQTLNTLNNIGQTSDPMMGFMSYIQALSELLGNLDHEQNSLKAMAASSKGCLRLEEAFEQARKRRSPVWSASERAVKQSHGDSALLMARQVASAVYGESLAYRYDEVLASQAQAIAIKANEVALERMFQSLKNAASAYQRVYSLG